MEDRLTSIDETSERLGVSTFTTRRLIKAGLLKAVRISKRVLVPETEVERAISQGCGKHANKSERRLPGESGLGEGRLNGQH
jgi:excisionase family DNA binding protein